ncbi:ABC transporter ATP-binding protein [Nitrospirillum sp. BR 11828]|uniref:ABC transporter ATP-binding protein n=1 Tax=Nitrospirillum sp. BR 11828 TaxID=3104325 RepID=UPI002ACAF503|nr:ABC transporter ATP-binding protein [Nitrospirillum sp. BR 11828]MDZ5650599.1 ABC transporter ATP-binding protein [Nitrospirillum sp. BR 11828]
MSSEIALKADDLGKAYLIYKRPEDRLKQMLFRWRRFYEEYWALRGVSLEIRKGESVGLVGRNGAGKSTFLQLAAGIIQPTTGSITTRGRIAALLELGAGFNPEFTGVENVRLSAAILGLSSEEIEDRFQSIAEFAAIGDFINLPVKLYSSGMYARLAFAVAAHVDASILIVDEILAVGDAAFTQKCMRFIRKFRENGTLIFVSHSPSSIMSLCDRAIWIDGGEVQEVGDAKVVCDNYLASLDRERDNGASFKIGGRRRSKEASAPAVRLPKAVNPIQVFSFDPEASWYGRRGATIESVRFLSSDRMPLQIMHGGEEVILQIRCSVADELSSPIVGFYIRDRLGQNLFGDNTYLRYESDPVSVQVGQELYAEFRFEMPYLPTGQYAVCCAIANGSQQDHVQHHWYDEALIFDVASSHIVQGLVGIPMLGVDLHAVDINGGAANPSPTVAVGE